jgi:serine protease AprX
MSKQITFLLSVVMIIVAASPVKALHSPKEWYETTLLDDKDGNKVEDILDSMLLEEPNMPIDAFICFLKDCRPDDRMIELERRAEQSGGRVGYASTVVASVVVKGMTVEQLICIGATWPEVGYIHMDHVQRTGMTTAGQSLGAHAGFYSLNTAEDQGFDGANITIAILDTGVDDPGGAGTTHNHLPTAVGAPGAAGLFIDASGNLAFGNPDDQDSHGTAVAGCALGRGDAAGNNRGIAPAADLFDCRITPPGATSNTSESNIQQVVDWLTWNHNTVVPAVRVANISFWNGCESAGTALTASIEALVASGVVVCVIAGNNDSCPTCTWQDVFGTWHIDPAGLGSIAVTSRAITVAAASHENTLNRNNDVIANYSRVGPSTGMDPQKPDITAYGNQCPVNCAVNDSGCSGADTVVIRAPDFNTNTGYRDFGGTSAASPMVAGAAALIIERNTAITPPAVKHLLMTNAEDMGPVGWDATWGAGLMDLRPIFQGPPPACDLAVTSVTYHSYAPAGSQVVQCYQPVDITVTVLNNGTTPVTDFVVNWERWYFGPNNQPAQRMPIGAVPEINTAGPLNPGNTRNFTRQWTPGVSDTLPLSLHSCFWGIVSAACDNNAGNNERNRNVTIVGVTPNFSCSPPAEPEMDGIVEVPFRIGHDEFGGRDIILSLDNPDPNNWYVELDIEGEVAPSSLRTYVDNQECPVWGTLRVVQENPEVTRVELTVKSADVEGEPLGEMQIIVDLTDQDEDRIVDVDDNCPDVPNAGQEDMDEDRVGDVCDNCPEKFNPDQKDSNRNGIGDSCDPLCETLGDLNEDCVVDIKDLAILSENWLVGKKVMDR